MYEQIYIPARNLWLNCLIYKWQFIINLIQVLESQKSEFSPKYIGIYAKVIT
jgi:hypothetical protein